MAGRTFRTPFSLVGAKTLMVLPCGSSKPHPSIIPWQIPTALRSFKAVVKWLRRKAAAARARLRRRSELVLEILALRHQLQRFRVGRFFQSGLQESSPRSPASSLTHEDRFNQSQNSRSTRLPERLRGRQRARGSGPRAPARSAQWPGSEEARECLGDLAGEPSCRRMFGDIQMQDLSSRVAKDHAHVEHSERGRHHHEHVDGGDASETHCAGKIAKSVTGSSAVGSCVSSRSPG